MTKVQTNSTIKTPGQPDPVEATPTAPVKVADPEPEPEEARYPAGDPEWTWRTTELYAWAEDNGLAVNEDMTKSDVWKAIKGERGED